MQIELYKASERGQADYGWLKPNYYFSFSNYYNPNRMQFGALRVLNDDFIAGGGQFPKHPHDNMEIVTIPFSGALEHMDNTGGQGVIQAGDIQIMSAGLGILHSEANASETEPVTLFQVWLLPKVANIKPRYSQQRFDEADSINQWQVLVSPREQDSALWINQDARFVQTHLQAQQLLTYHNAFTGNGAFVVVISGQAKIGTETLNHRDAAAISSTDSFTIEAATDSRILVIEVPLS